MPGSQTHKLQCSQTLMKLSFQTLEKCHLFSSRTEKTLNSKTNVKFCSEPETCHPDRINNLKFSLFSEAFQDRINVLKGLVDLSSLFSSWKGVKFILLIRYWNFISVDKMTLMTEIITKSSTEFNSPAKKEQNTQNWMTQTYLSGILSGTIIVKQKSGEENIKPYVKKWYQNNLRVSSKLKPKLLICYQWLHHLENWTKSKNEAAGTELQWGRRGHCPWAWGPHPACNGPHPILVAPPIRVLDT